MTPPAQMRYQVYNYKGPTPDSWSALRTQSWARLLWSAVLPKLAAPYRIRGR
jgi:hypothetical protein